MAASISGSFNLSSNYQTAQTSASSGNGAFRADYQALRQALQNGDLSGAQTAYNNLEQLIPSGAQSHTLPTALSAVGQALQAGNLSGAQQAFAALQQLVQQANAQHRSHQIAVSGGAPSVGGSGAPDTDGDGSGISSVAQGSGSTTAQQATNSLSLLNVIA